MHARDSPSGLLPMLWECDCYKNMMSKCKEYIGLLLVILVFEFSDFRLLRVVPVATYFLKNMLVRYRGINNKGVLDRPWTIWKVLKAISSTLKCQFVYRKMLKSGLSDAM